MNLEIGSGPKTAPTKNWHYLDARRLPGVTFVQDARDLSNIADRRYQTVYAKDVLEHIGWRDVPATLREWLRVTSGVLIIESPNAHEAVLMLADHELAGGSTAPWPETQFERFNRVMYGHQDYEENTHRSYFTPQWLERLLYEAGASEVTVTDKDITRFHMEARP